MRLVRDTRHVWILLLLITIGGVGFQAVRTALIPDDFGQLEPYGFVPNRDSARRRLLHEVTRLVLPVRHHDTQNSPYRQERC